MSNVTDPGAFTNRQRTGVIGGTVALRTPIKAINLMSFDPPRFNAGCGGIDLSLGSFSFISADQLVQVFRQIGANAAPLLFKAVIKGTSPQLDALITEFQALLQNMNNLAKNTCSLAKMIVDPLAGGIENALGGDGAIGGAFGGVFNDAMSTATHYLRNANETFAKNAPYAPKLGNGTMKAIVASGVGDILGLTGIDDGGDTYGPRDPNSLNNRVLVSLLGYTVAGVPYKSYGENGSEDDAKGGNRGDGAKAECVGRPLIDLDSLLIGGGSGSSRPTAKFQLYRCNNPGSLISGDGTDHQVCTDMQVTDYAYPGVRGWINNMLYGSPDASTIDGDSIIGQFNAGGNVTLSAAQRQFIHAAGGNLIAIVARVSNPNERIKVARSLSVPMEHCFMAEIGRALHAAANGIQRGNSYPVGPEQIKQIEKLRERRDHYEMLCTRDNTAAEHVQEILNATRLNTSPK
ncbi:hypothetical protein DFQ30_001609 [Apophysomyces sp. BC1015]|nr:hypothetical protein DFQ30_001609 [Apophysomyces sp. BC1015]